MKNILFRADSSSSIGTGHIMRDLVLASKYKDSNIIFAVKNLKGNINYKIKEAGYKIEILKSNKIQELDKLIKKLDIDLLVIDHYEIDYLQEKQLKIQNPTLKILSFDDTYEKHFCDMLINHNIYADKKKYKNLVPSYCELRCGSKYTLIRDEFIIAKEKPKSFKIQNSKFKIFIAIGGTDHSNINIKILEILEKFCNIEVNLVTTTANQNLDELKNSIKNKKWIKLYVNSNRIANLMQRSDFAIVTPSVILHEILYMGLPFMAIQTADNQKFMVEFLKKNDFTVYEMFDSFKLIVEMEKIIKGSVK